MSIESTYRIFRNDAILMLSEKHVNVFPSDSNERLEYELYQVRESIFVNFEVVDFTKEDEPENNKWHLWINY